MGVPSVDAAMNAVYKTMAAGITPVAMEFLDALCITAVEEKFHKGLPKGAGVWFARRNCSQAINIYGTLKLNEGITVPRSQLPELLRRIARIGDKYGVRLLCFGHTGDGNVHTNRHGRRQKR